MTFFREINRRPAAFVRATVCVCYYRVRERKKSTDFELNLIKARLEFISVRDSRSIGYRTAGRTQENGRGRSRKHYSRGQGPGTSGRDRFRG